MSRKTIKWLIFLVGVFVFVSIACTEKNIDEVSVYSSSLFCNKQLYVEDIYIHCDRKGNPPYDNNVEAKLLNLERGYTRNVNVILYLGWQDEANNCSVHFDVIGPGERVPILCQIKADKCYDSVSLNQTLSSCEYLSADEYIHQQSLNYEDTEGQDIIHGAEGDDEICGGDEDHDSTGEETLDISGLLDNFSGTWQASCPSLLPEYNCMLGDDTCTETNERTFNLDFNTMTFSYENQWSYYDKGDEWEGTYEDCHGSINSQGKIYKDGWMMGIENFQSHCDYVAWMFGILQDGERDIQRTNILIATLQLEPQPAVVFTRYAPPEDLDISGYDQVPGSYKTLINDLSTVCPITPTD